MAATPQELALRKTDNFYESADIEVIKNAKVVKVDSKNNTVETHDGRVFNYNYLVLPYSRLQNGHNIFVGSSNSFKNSSNSNLCI